MKSSKTQWINSQKHHTNSSKKQRFIYLSPRDKNYRLKNTLTILLSKINFDSWKKTYLLKGIDILWNSLIIYLIIASWTQGSKFLKGVSITLFFIVFLSYLEDIKNVFKK